MGNSNATVGNVKKTEVLWESFGTDVMPNVGDLVTGVGYKNGYVYFSTPAEFKNGNASIAVRNSKDVILWSWHIWCSEEGWNDHIYANNAGTMMDRNLGATSATPGDIGAFGLMYQWGRKDPFMGSCAKSGTTLAASTGTWNKVSSAQTIEYVEENPMTYVCSDEWCTGIGSGYTPGEWRWKNAEKTLYDPCPVGYRVPKGGDDSFWETALAETTWSEATRWDDTNAGRHWTLANGTTEAWYPATGTRNKYGDLTGVGSNGYYWYSSHDRGNSSYAESLTFSKSNLYSASGFRADSRSVRCVKE